MIIGHQKQWDFLKNMVVLDKVPHALLFSGEEKLGKKKLAFEFAKLLLGQDIGKQLHPDFFFIQPRNKNIQIAQIRDLAEKIGQKSYYGSWKVAILDQAHSMTQEAQNCLLKTLEEPLGKTCMILVSEHPFLLLATILSRVQEIKFFPVKNQPTQEYLKSQGLSEQSIAEILKFSFGRPGLAIDFLLDPEKLKDQKKKIQEFLAILRGDLVFRFQKAAALSKSTPDLKEILDIWLNYLRKTLFAKMEKKDFEGVLKIKGILEEVARVRPVLVDINVNKRLALENLFLQI